MFSKRMMQSLDVLASFLQELRLLKLFSIACLLVIYLPAWSADLALTTSTDNTSEVYLNGVLIGTSNDWQQSKSYSAALQNGVNVLAVKGTDTGGMAGLIAELNWSGGNAISDTSWKVSNNAPAGWEAIGFNDSAWANAVSYGQYGVSPWFKNVVGFPNNSSAKWIWTADNENDNTAYLRYTFTVAGGANTPPTVSLTAPVNGATYTAPASFTLSATATDSDGGSISQVEFYNGTMLLNTDTSVPYSLNWTNVPAGSYSLTAKATDNSNASTVSSPVTIAVVADAEGPVISTSMPATQAVLPASALPTISASYSDNGSGINTANTKLTVDGQDVTAQAQVTSSGISFTPAQPLAEGDHNITLGVADNSGNLSNASWMFTTRTPPEITGFPANQQEITDPRTPITASYNDLGAGIDPTRTVLTIDGVAAAAQGNATALTFTPTSDWSTGTHSVSLTVFDLAGNSANAAWSFKYDPPPQIYDETPRDVYVAVPDPLIRVLLRDMGNGINLAATTLKLDGVDVSAQASITAAEIRFTPAALSAGVYTLTVQTQSNTGKIATKEWQFTVMLPPAPAVTEDGVRTPPVLNIPMQTLP